MKNSAIIVLLFIIGFIAPITCIVKHEIFFQQCGGFLKQAADASTPEMALERINLAIDYIEAHGLTNGYTSVLYKTEDENIGFWYKNIIAARSELESCLDAPQLEQSNVLMRVREALTDNGESGTTLTIPYGISRYPQNGLWGILRIISYILLIVAIIKFIAEIS